MWAIWSCSSGSVLWHWCKRGLWMNFIQYERREKHFKILILYLISETKWPRNMKTWHNSHNNIPLCGRLFAVKQTNPIHFPMYNFVLLQMVPITWHYQRLFHLWLCSYYMISIHTFTGNIRTSLIVNPMWPHCYMDSDWSMRVFGPMQWTIFPSYKEIESMCNNQIYDTQIRMNVICQIVDNAYMMKSVQGINFKHS